MSAGVTKVGEAAAPVTAAVSAGATRVGEASAPARARLSETLAPVTEKVRVVPSFFLSSSHDNTPRVVTPGS